MDPVPDRLGIHSTGGAGHPMSGSQSSAGWGRGSSMRRASVAPTARSSIWPKAFRRRRPARSTTTRLGVPRSWYRPMVMGSLDCPSCASTPTGKVIRYSYREGLKGDRRHGLVMLEHPKQPQYGQSVAEDLLDSHGPEEVRGRRNPDRASGTPPSPPPRLASRPEADWRWC